MPSSAAFSNLCIVLLWGLVVAVTLIIRPLLPVDETRYLAVAWDMWLEGHYLVPHLNGEPYSHKPPLLFWLITAGWHIFGVNEWWPRLVAPIFGFGTVLLTKVFASVLWPDRREISVTAPLILLGSLFWSLFTTLTMFDVLLAFFTLSALISLILTARKGRLRGFLLVGLMIGFGVLAKGPAIFIHYIPAAILAPWWVNLLPNWNKAVVWNWKRWYLGVSISLLSAICVGLAWAIPAGIAGGEVYRDAIFWGQSAGRIVNSFAHARPFWWYLAVLPVLVLPWLVWPPLWRRVSIKAARADGAQRLCIIWFVVAFAVFSLINGKQMHYLLPEFPALALLAACMIGKGNGERRIDSVLPGVFFVLIGVAILTIPSLFPMGRLAETLIEMKIQWSALIIVSGAVVIASRAKTFGLCLASTLSVVAVHLVVSPVFSSRYYLAPIANEIRNHQIAGREVANFGKYHGQYHFLGRLIKPIKVIGQTSGDEQRFLAENSNGVVVAYYENLPPHPTPIFTHTYRRLTLAIWPARALIDFPGIADRQ